MAEQSGSASPGSDSASPRPSHFIEMDGMVYPVYKMEYNGVPPSCEVTPPAEQGTQLQWRQHKPRTAVNKLHFSKDDNTLSALAPTTSRDNPIQRLMKVVH